MKPVAISAFDAMNSPRLLGPFFTGPSWNTWRAVIKAMFAEPMNAIEIETFRAVAERDPPPAPVSEAVFIAGRGAGKDSVATSIATNIAVNFDPKRHRLRPGERALVMLLAVDRAQAGVAFSYIRGYFEGEVVAEIAALLKTYRCSHVTGDKYAAQWVVEAFAKLGITYRHSEVDRSMIYLDCLPLFTSGRARLIDSPRLVAQFSALERRAFPTGRDRVDHGRSGRDDLCNACAGALVLAARPVFDDVPIVMPIVVSGGPRNIPGQYSPRIY